jgi:peptidyl-prolyl cis-trans isomerase SurA
MIAIVFSSRLLCVFLCLALAAPWAQAQTKKTKPPQMADYIVAVVNRESVTNAELELRLQQAREEARRNGQRLPGADELRAQVLNALIDERAQITHAREVGQRVDDNDLDRAVANVAAQNQLTVPQLRQRLVEDGMDYARFRATLRDQILLERVREREVRARINVTDTEIDTWLATQPGSQQAASAQYNLAQVFISVPEGAKPDILKNKKDLALSLLKRVQAGEAFDAIARENSEDLNKAKGGEIGLRSPDRLPDVFVQAVRNLQPGDTAPEVVTTSAGFHLLKLLNKREAGARVVNETKVRHILLRTGVAANTEAVVRRMQGIQKRVAGSAQNFAKMARDTSEDASAPQGGDLGWVSPGSLVPEFEEAMNALAPGSVSGPVVSRFGVHLIQVLERREKQIEPQQLREQAKAALREQKMQKTTTDWTKELRARAYVEMREAPP